MGFVLNGVLSALCLRATVKPLFTNRCHTFYSYISRVYLPQRRERADKSNRANGFLKRHFEACFPVFCFFLKFCFVFFASGWFVSQVLPGYVPALIIVTETYCPQACGKLSSFMKEGRTCTSSINATYVSAHFLLLPPPSSSLLFHVLDNI